MTRRYALLGPDGPYESADRQTARASGYRPCGDCLPEEHAAWRAASRD